MNESNIISNKNTIPNTMSHVSLLLSKSMLVVGSNTGLASSIFYSKKNGALHVEGKFINNK